MKKFSMLIMLTCFIFSSSANSQPLPKDAPELKQLIAMGYEIEKEDPGDTFTVANNGGNKIAISRNSERLAVARYFNRQRKNLSQAEEHELLKIINTLNKDYTIGFSVSDGFITAIIYDFGAYDAKTFAKIVRKLDKVDVVFDLQPRILRLVNN